MRESGSRIHAPLISSAKKNPDKNKGKLRWCTAGTSKRKFCSRIGEEAEAGAIQHDGCGYVCVCVWHGAVRKWRRRRCRNPHWCRYHGGRGEFTGGVGRYRRSLTLD